jgi:hypothetical protein
MLRDVHLSCKVCNGLWLKVGVGCDSGSQGRVVIIMTVLLTEQSVNLGSIPCKYIEFFHLIAAFRSAVGRWKFIVVGGGLTF